MIPIMKPKNCFSTTLLCIYLILLLPTLISSQYCQRTCGNLHLKYPFGSGPGCGDPRFHPYVTCSQEKLTLTTHTGCYTITAIDYNIKVLYITDPSMSTCSCAQPSKGFGLDWNAPFSFDDNNIFALLDCSITSSPIYKPDGFYGGGNSTLAPLCDSEGASICSLLYSCRPISALNTPISTCCVYTPVDLGPSFEMDLQKLKCTSYSGFYSFNGQDSNPQSWEYGVALKYKFSFSNDYPGACADCERSNGVCGYTGDYNSFICNCPGDRLNTTGDCLYSPYWSRGLRLLPWKIGGIIQTHFNFMYIKDFLVFLSLIRFGWNILVFLQECGCRFILWHCFWVGYLRLHVKIKTRLQHPERELEKTLQCYHYKCQGKS